MLALKAENISKQYRLGMVGTGTITHDLNRFWHRMRGKEDPYLKIGEANDRTSKGSSEYVWSLRDINFEIEQGDAVGIIGRNGAGKSTLLKILSKVTQPTTGKIYTNGRIASLLEVGTGFHPEMSGRENVFLNGAILGMTQKEIKRKFDEIVDFSGVERYIDTPVKRYSSGMYVRLAFAVAAHLESEILIVDEVLAVGDAEFQKKCLGKMNDVTKGEGRTILFVSHQLAAISALCNKGILLQNGLIKENGLIGNVINRYIDTGVTSSGKYKADHIEENTINEVTIINKSGTPTNNFNFNEEISINFKFNLDSKLAGKTEISFRVIDKREKTVFTSEKNVASFDSYNDMYNITSTIPSNVLVPNQYKLVIALHIPNEKILSIINEEVSFNIEETGTDFHKYNGNDYGCVFISCKWIDK
ncbi:ABC transporter ATP-binding protein [Chryseobacterium caseinilyticum]|uniref:ATP-binding cassette domain-containing protein n=1 Tax=Chryseobacterium caseinilyticum TaxID=2771428 RepID=A0ABR8ZGE9_9FLAO|nr:polysaccharide ABC transporter ATP-binding protein [Chryseobacterium caseinilyticum]MBD8084297.1 ATP-binding cassette domain-containing protein [Chryseobacterium caseinilyticum]